MFWLKQPNQFKPVDVRYLFTFLIQVSIRHYKLAFIFKF